MITVVLSNFHSRQRPVLAVIQTYDTRNHGTKPGQNVVNILSSLASSFPNSHFFFLPEHPDRLAKGIDRPLRVVGRMHRRNQRTGPG